MVDKDLVEAVNMEYMAYCSVMLENPKALPEHKRDFNKAKRVYSKRLTNLGVTPRKASRMLHDTKAGVVNVCNFKSEDAVNDTDALFKTFIKTALQ